MIHRLIAWMASNAQALASLGGGLAIILTIRHWAGEHWGTVRARIHTPHLTAIAIICFTISFLADDREVDLLTFTVAGLAIGTSVVIEINRRVWKPLMGRLEANSELIDAQLTRNHGASLLDMVHAMHRALPTIIEEQRAAAHRLEKIEQAGPLHEFLTTGHQEVLDRLDSIDERLCATPQGCPLVKGATS